LMQQDLRMYQFTPLSPTDLGSRKMYHPTQEQIKAAQQLITALDLMDAEDDPEGANGAKMEALKPRRTHNPALQRFYQVVQHKALFPQRPLPPVDPAVARILEPNAALFARAEPFLQEFQRLFKLEKAPEVQKAEKRTFWHDKVDDSSRDITVGAPAALQADESGAPSGKKRKTEGGELNVDALLAQDILAVGSVAPVKDFEAMLSRRDIDLVGKAIEQMVGRIRQLVFDSIGDQYFPKALECILALRRGCVQEDEPQAFNDLLLRLRRETEGRSRDAFWQMVAGVRVAPIHTGESLYSVVTKEESEQFYEARPAAAAPALLISEAKREEFVDELFKMAD